MEFNQRRVFVAGATGYLGGFVVSEFLSRGYEVLALSRSERGAEKLTKSGATAVVAEATERTSLVGHFEGVDLVVSSLGITRQKDGLSYDDVDYQANVNLLRAAEEAEVAQFVYVSVFEGEALSSHSAMVGAKEKFVQELRDSSVQSIVVRPTGFFSDMDQFLSMAQKGRVWVFGAGDQQFNPISGDDLAEAIADAAADPNGGALTGALGDELAIGGPEDLTMREIGQLAFAAVGTTPKVSSVPMWVVGSMEWLLPKITPLSVYGPIQFFLAVSHLNMVAPAHGRHRLADHYARVVAESA